MNSSGIDANLYYDIPGNHEHYNDQHFEYYLANSIQGHATGQTQISWTRNFSFGKYHFLGINSADNTGSPFSIFWPWGDYAGLDENELAFINSELEQNLDADLTFIFGHHPVTNTGHLGETWLYYGASDFVGYIDNYGASLYGYGHTHRFEEDIFTGDNYTGYMSGDGVHYFNIASLGKSSENQYSIFAIDCNGISIVTENVNSWPVVLITAPIDKYFGFVENPYSYPVPNSNKNPIRALVFDASSVMDVQYRIDVSGDWYPMNVVPSNPNLWEALWDASSLSGGEHTVEVRATSASGTKTDVIIVSVTDPVPIPDIKVNGQDEPLFVNQNESVNCTISLDPGDKAGAWAEWWGILLSSYGTFPLFAFQAPLFELPVTSLFDVPLPPGWYVFLFNVEDTADGAFQLGWYDYVVVVVIGAESQVEEFSDFDSLNSLHRTP